MDTQTLTITPFLVYHKNKIRKNCKIYLITGTNNQTKMNTPKQTSMKLKTKRLNQKQSPKPTYTHTIGKFTKT